MDIRQNNIYCKIIPSRQYMRSFGAAFLLQSAGGTSPAPTTVVTSGAVGDGLARPAKHTSSTASVRLQNAYPHFPSEGKAFGTVGSDSRIARPGFAAFCFRFAQTKQLVILSEAQRSRRTSERKSLRRRKAARHARRRSQILRLRLRLRSG